MQYLITSEPYREAFLSSGTSLIQSYKSFLQAIWLLCTGAREAAFRNIKSIAECLSDELINAAKVKLSFAVGIIVVDCFLFRRAPPTATQSRRRMSWSVWPSPTDKHGGHIMVPAGFLAVE